MIHPAITAAVQAATEFAESLKSLQGVLNPGLVVGQQITAEQAAQLPVGAKFRDNEDDVWTKTDTGFTLSAHSYGTDTTCEPQNFQPLTLEHLPEVEAQPEPEPSFAEGDKVTITGLSRYGANNKGRTGTVGRPDHHGDVEVFVDGVQYVYPKDHIAKVETSAPTALDRDSKYADRQIKVTPSWVGSTDARIQLTEPLTGKRVFAFLTPDIAREVAATLVAIADGADVSSPSSPF